MSFNWVEGNWRSHTDITQVSLPVPLYEIGCPWARNIHNNVSYNRLFWDIWDYGIKTPLLVRPWQHQLTMHHTSNCTHIGNRLDAQPSPQYDKQPKFELILGNMRYCALYTQGVQFVPILMLPLSEHTTPVQQLWDKYHPVMEGNWYDNKNHQFPSKYAIGYN